MAKYKPECVQPNVVQRSPTEGYAVRPRACISPSSPIRTMLDPISNMPPRIGVRTFAS